MEQSFRLSYMCNEIDFDSFQKMNWKTKLNEAIFPSKIVHALQSVDEMVEEKNVVRKIDDTYIVLIKDLIVLRIFIAEWKELEYDDFNWHHELKKLNSFLT